MYLELFKLRELPFRLSPDPQFLFLSKDHARAKAYMESTIWFTDGFVVVTGEIGAGKTTLIETFLRELEKDVIVAQVSQTQVSVLEFLQSVLVQFGFTPFQMKKAELLATLNTFLIEQYAAGRKVLLIVDEAQNLNLRVLEEIRLLSGVETTKEKVLRIILAGQPELNEKMDAPELIQLAQRVRLRFHLGALSPEDTQGYILHRLEVAGSQGRTIFQPECFATIYRYTGGVPRLINTLCDTAMLAAFNVERDQVLPEDLTAAIEELQWTEFSVRTAAGAHPPTIHGRRSPHPDRTEDNQVPAAPLARLLLINEGRTLSERPLYPGRLIIGRASDADLRVDSRMISRHHCQIVTNDRLCTIEDLNSTNGIFIKDKRLRYHNLNDGDVVSIGTHQLMYIDERPGHKAVATDSLAATGPQKVLELPAAAESAAGNGGGKKGSAATS
jgi:type II secretory pathway predicted ATPase ExeA